MDHPTIRVTCMEKHISRNQRTRFRVRHPTGHMLVTLDRKDRPEVRTDRIETQLLDLRRIHVAFEEILDLAARIARRCGTLDHLIDNLMNLSIGIIAQNRRLPVVPMGVGNLGGLNPALIGIGEQDVLRLLASDGDLPDSLTFNPRRFIPDTKVALDRFSCAKSQIDKSLGLRHATGQSRHLGPEAAFFRLMDDNPEYHWTIVRRPNMIIRSRPALSFELSL